VREWLAEKGMEWPELVIENGAGLSRNERVSARHLGELLLAAYRSPTMPELMSSLPIVAIDGTMQQRLKSSAVAGQAHIKTGSLDGVRAMAGYLLDAKGRRWVVVLMTNHPAAASSKTAQDALLEYIYALP
jgi:D-alanyl-D-alanine carboxypeptidase/D-alanyl-D-alanine-endopeptidase (penicillin-binding protein 4)